MDFKLIRFLACAVLVCGATAIPCRGDEPPATTQPATQPAAVKVSPEARQLLDQLGEAYAKLKTLEVSGTFSGNIDAAGQQFSESSKFTASFQSPNKFRHAMENDILCGSTGDKAYSYLKARNIFATADAPKDKVASDELPRPLPSVLAVQNPSILLALAKEPVKELIEDATEVARVDDTKIGDVSFPTLRITLKDETIRTYVLDPSTHLLRQCITDDRAILKARQVPDVKLATFTVDYATTTPDAAVQQRQFAWAPPEGAKDFAKIASADAPGEAAAMLEGKNAPDFKLKGMDGKQVTLAELRGQVIVLDFWATWCGPCRVSLPHLQMLYESKKDTGVQVFAVNQNEEKEKVQKFIEETKLTVPVLLDSEGNIGEKYFVDGIPQTVVIGKDGKVKKVFIGFGDTMPDELAKAVADAQK